MAERQTGALPRLLVLASTYPRWKNDPEPGFVHELSKRLVHLFDVTVLCPHAIGAARNERMDGVKVVRYRYAPERLQTLVNDGGIVANLKRAKLKFLLVPGFVLAQAWYAWRLIRKGEVDVIHAHWLVPQGLIAALVQYLPGRKVPFVVTSHGADLYALQGGLLDALKRFVVRRSAAVTVVSGAMRGSLELIGADVGKVSVLSMGVDVSERFRPDPEVERSSDEILFVGRLVEKKGVGYLIGALPEIVRQRPSAFLTIAGFGPEEKRLRRLVEDLGLEEKVRFLGALPQSELPALYRRAALFVAPFVKAESGDQEGLGLVLVEAIACGCPVLVGDVPAVAEVLGDSVADSLVRPRDTAQLAARIVEILADPAATSTRAAQLRESVGQRFGWGRVSERYAGLLNTTASAGTS